MADDKEHQHGEESHGGGHGGGHHGGGHAEGEHEGAPEWLISFADNVMLIMAFFVIMLALNMGPKGHGSPSGETNTNAVYRDRMLDFVIGVREGFNRKVRLDSTDPSDQPLIERLKRRMGEAHEEGPEGDFDRVQAPRPTDYSSIGALVPFDDGSDLVSSSARALVLDVAQRTRDQRFIVEVRGHSSPSETFRSPERGLDLSYRRALAVARALVEDGLRWEQIRIGASSDGDRLVARTYSREEDRRNQRVEIILTNDTLPPDPYARETPRPAPAGGGAP